MRIESIIRNRSRRLIAASIVLGGGLVLAGGQTAAGASNAGAIWVTKSLAPASDDGRFDLKVGALVVRTGAGEGDTGLATPPPGTYTVSEEATSVPLSKYKRSISCTKNGAAYVANSSDSAVDVTIRSGDRASCTITNERLVDTVTVPASAVSYFFNVIWNTWTVQFLATVVAESAQPVNEGTVWMSFRLADGHGTGCTARVIDGVAACGALWLGSQGAGWPVGTTSASYSGSATYAPSSGTING